MKVITIAVVNGRVVNEKELIASIADYDDFTAVAEQLRKGLKSRDSTTNRIKIKFQTLLPRATPSRRS